MRAAAVKSQVDDRSTAVVVDPVDLPAELERMRASVLGLCVEYATALDGGGSSSSSGDRGIPTGSMANLTAARREWEQSCSATTALVEKCCREISRSSIPPT